MSKVTSPMLATVFEEMEAPGPDGWVFDGIRRTYTDGTTPTGWVARQVQPGRVKTSGGQLTVPLIEGKGATIMEAMKDMAQKFKDRT
jgi:hypothetical protein